MKSPFWWVVKSRDGGYLGPYVDKHVEYQREARQHLSRKTAKEAAAWWEDDSHVVVKVWARLPVPKLPPWVGDRPDPLGSKHVAVWRIGPREAERYVFRVGAGGCWLTWKDIFRRGGKDDGYTNASVAPAEVWVEAGLRAAAFLRAEKRAGR